MFLVHRLPGRRRATGWREADAAALAIADVTSIHVKPSSVRTVVAQTRRRYGGAEGVAAELQRRMTDTPRQTARTLSWARGVLASIPQLGPSATEGSVRP